LKAVANSEIKTLLDAAHRAVLHAFKVPERDRYQIVHENKAHHMVIEDTGLGLTRSNIWWWCGSIPARAAKNRSSSSSPPCSLSWRNTAA
jgi:HSP90 family molecular chaperone